MYLQLLETFLEVSDVLRVISIQGKNPGPLPNMNPQTNDVELEWNAQSYKYFANLVGAGGGGEGVLFQS